MIAIIAAYDKNRVIGNNGKIPWNIKGEQTRFRELTTGKIVIMGRRTFEEIGKPLPNRTTIVISTTKSFDSENCFTVCSLDEALKLAGGKDVFICGGERLYTEALPYAYKLYLTEIEAEFDGDRYFPPFDESRFLKTCDKKDGGEIPYSYYTHTRRGCPQIKDKSE